MMSEGVSDSGERILIILLGAIGDVVRGLSVVNFIKRACPKAHITWLVEPASHAIVSLHRGVDEVLVFRRMEGARGVLTVIRELRARKFDVTLDMQRHLKSGIFSLLSRSPRRIGFHRKDSKEFNWLFNNSFIQEKGDSGSKLDHYLEFVAALGLPLNGQVDAGLSHIDLASVRDEVRSALSGPYVALILGSSRDSKDWPEEGYQGILEKFNIRGIDQVVLLGDRRKAEMSERITGAKARVKVLNLVGKTSLREVVGILSGAVAALGPDSGPGHIAGALGVPHVTLFGPTPRARNAPLGSEELSVVSPIACSPCRRRVCPGLDKLCMRLISPDVVITQLERAVSRR
jgi:lipopolysaccharide heptosyltransferase I